MWFEPLVSLCGQSSITDMTGWEATVVGCMAPASCRSWLLVGINAFPGKRQLVVTCCVIGVIFDSVINIYVHEKICCWSNHVGYSMGIECVYVYSWWTKNCSVKLYQLHQSLCWETNNVELCVKIAIELWWNISCLQKCVSVGNNTTATSGIGDSWSDGWLFM
jgi:hypothetical protein